MSRAGGRGKDHPEMGVCVLSGRLPVPTGMLGTGSAPGVSWPSR